MVLKRCGLGSRQPQHLGNVIATGRLLREEHMVGGPTGGTTTMVERMWTHLCNNGLARAAR